MSPGLFQDFMDGFMVMTEGSQSRQSQTESYGSQFFISV